MNFGSNKSKSKSESKPDVWKGLEPYVTGGPSGNAGPIDRWMPMEVNPQWSDWNQAVGQGLFLGPPPPMQMRNGTPGYYNVGGEEWDEDLMNPTYIPEPQQTSHPLSSNRFWPLLEMVAAQERRDVNNAKVTDNLRYGVQGGF